MSILRGAFLIVRCREINLDVELYLINSLYVESRGILGKFSRLINNRNAVISIIVGAIILSGITYYLNSILPQPETIKAFLSHFLHNPGQLMLTTLMNLAAFCLAFLSGSILIAIAISNLINIKDYETTKVDKLLILLIGLVGLAALIFSFVFFTYFVKLLVVVCIIAAIAYALIHIFSGDR